MGHMTQPQPTVS